MISRHIVRVKVMQQLYAATRKEKTALKQLTTGYHQMVDDVFELFLLNLWYLTRIARYSKIDKEKRHSKHRPTPADLAFQSHLFDNEIIQSLYNNQGLKTLFAQYHIGDIGQNDFVKSIYRNFAKTELYQEYVMMTSPSIENHKQIMKELLKFLAKDEHFNEIQIDFHASWNEDKSLVVGAMKKTIKAAPVEGDFYKNYLPKTTAAYEFGNELLERVYQDDESLLEMVVPFLQNWDVNRLAIIDLILLKMAVTELLYFPSIPVKVTLNEYVDISKIYSTDKSKSFINGVLDRMMKQFDEEGKIEKLGRGLK